jgi:phosphoglycolate phosphatase
MFDLDGTLLDTIEDLADAMNAALAANGLPTHPDYAKHKYMVGDGVRNYIQRALPEARRDDEKTIAAVAKVYRVNYAAGWRGKTKPYDGIEAMLAELAGRGVRLTVLSNKPDDFSREMVAAYFPGVRFEIVRGALEGRPLKPDPAAAVEIAGAMGVPPAEFAYLGDTATDMLTANAAGMFPIGALWGFRLADELLGGGAKILIRHPRELAGLL